MRCFNVFVGCVCAVLYDVVRFLMPRLVLCLCVCVLSQVC